MRTVVRLPLRRVCNALEVTSIKCPVGRAFSTLTSPFRPGDHVILRPIRNDDDPGRLVQLKENGRFESHRGAADHSDILGRLPREIVTTTQGVRLRVYHASLKDYITQTPRKVTPIYANEAAIIVDAIDTHSVAPRDARDEEEQTGPFEVFEAGTGHGALTLHLARALHAANVPCTQPTVTEGNITQPSLGATDRAAILHTLDRSEQHSMHARKIVRSFRNGLYAGDVDFHVGAIAGFISSDMARREHQPFLSAAVLDLPDVDSEMQAVTPALLPDAPLALFCPSITQLVDCTRLIKAKGLPLAMDKVLDLSDGAGGRLWDLQLVRPKRQPFKPKTQPHVNVEAQLEETGDSGEAVMDDSSVETGSGSELSEPDPSDNPENWKAVCRPKFGGRVTASGFLGVWRRTRSI